MLDFWRFDAWYSIVLSAICWLSLYNLFRVLLPDKTPEYWCRLNSFLHGAITSFLGLNQCFYLDIPFNHPEWHTTQTQSLILVISLGYFICDLIWLLIYQRHAKLIVIHHIYSVIAVTIMLHRGYSGSSATCALGDFEITNPFLQLRWLLRYEGYSETVVYVSLEITFLIVYILARIVFGTYIVIIILLQPNNDWNNRLLIIVIYIISWMFMINISKYFINKYGWGTVSVDDLRKIYA